MHGRLSGIGKGEISEEISVKISEDSGNHRSIEQLNMLVVYSKH